MQVQHYKMANGNPWGFFVIGHFDPDLVLECLNQKITDEGFLPVTADYISKVWAANVTGIPKQPFYNTHVFGEEVEGATPITWVDGNSLEVEYHPALDEQV